MIAFTLFRQGDNTSVDSQRDIFFLYYMTNNAILNFVAFAVNYLGKVACAATRGISVKGMITQIIEQLGIEFNLVEDRIVEGRIKVGMDAHVHQGMIFMDGNTYTVMICNKAILDLPNRRKVRIDIPDNYIYQAVVSSSGNSSEEEGEPDITNHPTGTTMEEDIVPPPTLPTQNKVGLQA